MKIVETFVADDGTVFFDREKCEKYEKSSKKNSDLDVLCAIKNLDILIWTKYHPGEAIGEPVPLKNALEWLRADIISIMVEIPGSESDILSIIKASEYGDRILNNYLDMTTIRGIVAIKTDFQSAFKSVRHGYELSEKIEYALSKRDLNELAKLHKMNKYRKKIEELLTDCDFHYECAEFENGNYDEFLSYSKDCN